MCAIALILRLNRLNPRAASTSASQATPRTCAAILTNALCPFATRSLLALSSPPRARPPQCHAMQQCFTCWPDSTCEPIYDYKRLTVSEHGRVRVGAPPS